MMDCAFTSGPGHAEYVFSKNVLVPSWVNSMAPTSTLSSSVVANAYPSPLQNYIPGGQGTIKFSATNNTGTYKGLDLRLAAQSPYIKTSTDGTQAGANMEQLQQAQGRIIQLRPLTVAATSATISAFVPDAGRECYVGYGTSEAVASWTWTPADSANTRQRNVPISGLTSQTRYFYSMACAHTAMPSIEVFRTE